MIGLFVVLFIVAQFTDTSSPSSSPGADFAASVTICQQRVKDRLRSPSTADFPWGYTDRISETGDGSYVYRAYVDAENAFGAEVRTDFVCQFRPSGSGWTIEDVELVSR